MCFWLGRHVDAHLRVSASREALHRNFKRALQGIYLPMPTSCWCRCRCRNAPVIVQLNSGALISYPCESMNSAVCRLFFVTAGLFGPRPPLDLFAPPVATQLNFPGAKHQFNSGLQLSAFTPSRVGSTASSLLFITFLCKSPAAFDLCVCACACACACASGSWLGTGYLHAVKGLNW